MAKKISSRDIFQEVDIFKGIRDSATETIKKMELLQKEVQETATALKEINRGCEVRLIQGDQTTSSRQPAHANKLAKGIGPDRQSKNAKRR